MVLSVTGQPNRAGAMTVILHSALGDADERAEVRVEVGDAELVVEKVIAGLTSRFNPESVVTIHTGHVSEDNVDESTGTSGQHWSSSAGSSSDTSNEGEYSLPRNADIHPVEESNPYHQSVASTSTSHDSHIPTMPSPTDLAESYRQGFLAKFGTTSDAALASQTGCRALDKAKRAVGLPVDDSVDFSRVFNEAHTSEMRRTGDPHLSVQAAARAADIAAASVGAAPCGRLILQVFDRVLDGQKRIHTSPSVAFPRAIKAAMFASENVPIVHSQFEGTLFTPQRLVTIFTKAFVETLRENHSVRDASSVGRKVIIDLMTRLETATTSFTHIGSEVTSAMLYKSFERAFIAELRRTNDASIASVIGCQTVDRIKATRDIALTAPLNLSRIFKRVYTAELNNVPGSHIAARTAANNAVDTAAGAIGAAKMSLLLDDTFEAAYAREFKRTRDVNLSCIAGGKASARAAEFVPIVSLSALAPGSPAPSVLLEAFTTSLLESLDESGDTMESAWTALEAVNLAKLKNPGQYRLPSSQHPEFMSDYTSSVNSAVPSRRSNEARLVTSSYEERTPLHNSTDRDHLPTNAPRRLFSSDGQRTRQQTTPIPSQRRASCQARVCGSSPPSLRMPTPSAPQSPPVASPDDVNRAYQTAFFAMYKRTHDGDESHSAGINAAHKIRLNSIYVDCSRIFTRAYISILERSGGDHQLAANKSIKSFDNVCQMIGTISSGQCFATIYKHIFDSVFHEDVSNPDAAAVEAARTVSRLSAKMPVVGQLPHDVPAVIATYRHSVAASLKRLSDIDRGLTDAERSAAQEIASQRRRFVVPSAMSSTASTWKHESLRQQPSLTRPPKVSSRSRDVLSWDIRHQFTESDLYRIIAVYIKSLGRELRRSAGDVEHSVVVAVRATDVVRRSLGHPSTLLVDLSPVYQRVYKKTLRSYRNRQKAAMLASVAVDKTASRVGAIVPSLAIGMAGRDAYERKLKATGNRDRSAIAYAKASAIVCTKVPILTVGYRKQSSSLSHDTSHKEPKDRVASSPPHVPGHKEPKSERSTLPYVSGYRETRDRSTLRYDSGHKEPKETRDRSYLPHVPGYRESRDRSSLPYVPGHKEPKERVSSFIDEVTRVRFREVPVVKEVVRQVPVKRIEYIEKRVPVPAAAPDPPTRIEYIDKIVEVPKIEEKIICVPKKTIVERPIEKIIYVNKTTCTEKTNVQYRDTLVPTVVAQTITPIVSQGTQRKFVDCLDIEPVLVPVDLYVPKLVESGVNCIKHSEEHRKVCISGTHWNTLVMATNPQSDWKFLPLVKNSQGGVDVLHPPPPIVPPIEAIPIVPGERATSLYTYPNQYT